MSLQRQIELAAKSLVDTSAGCSAVTTDGIGIVWFGSQVTVRCADSADDTGLPGNETFDLTVEVETLVNLYAVRATGVSSHHILRDAIDNAINIVELAAELNARATSAVVVGVNLNTKRNHSQQSNKLTSSITRTIHTIAP